jgi:amphi-Trp domain-containing protein
MSSSNKKSIKLERTLSSSAAAALLEEIACGLRASELLLQGENAITLHPGSVLQIELEAKEKPSKGSLVLKLSWQPPLVTIAGQASILRVHSGAEVIEEAPAVEPVAASVATVVSTKASREVVTSATASSEPSRAVSSSRKTAAAPKKRAAPKRRTGNRS